MSVSAAAPPTRSLSIVIPAFNEETRLPRTLLEIHRVVTQRGYDAEILVVNDGSRDRTADVVAALQPELPLVRLINHGHNTGKGFAVRAGILAARRDAVLFSDADLSTPIEDLDRLWPWWDRGYPVVIASRAEARSELLRRQPWHRHAMGRVFNGLTSLVAVRGFRDTQCGFKLFRADAARRLFSGLKTTGFAFDVEILLRARRLGYRVAEVGVRWADAEGSRIQPLRDSARMLLELLKMRGIR